jgi:hypothetical protein
VRAITATPSTATADHRRAIEELLAAVAATEADDAGWEVLRRRARSLTRSLADAGIVPEGTVTAADDVPVVVARGLLVAARHLDAAPAALASSTQSERRRGAWVSCDTVAS